MSLTLGKLQHRLRIEAPLEADDGYGGVEVTGWTEIKTVWGSIDPLTTRDLYFAQGISPRITHAIRLTSKAAEGVQSKFRVIYGARKFKILSPPLLDRSSNSSELDFFAKLLVEELVN